MPWRHDVGGAWQAARHLAVDRGERAEEYPSGDDGCTRYRDPHDGERPTRIRIANKIVGKPLHRLLVGRFDGEDLWEIVERGANDQKHGCKAERSDVIVHAAREFDRERQQQEQCGEWPGDGKLTVVDEGGREENQAHAKGGQHDSVTHQQVRHPPDIGSQP